MAFPTVGTIVKSKLTAAGTSFTINFTQTTGNRIVIWLFLVTSQTLSTVGDSFTNATNWSGFLHVIDKVLDGSEGGTVAVTWGTSCKACAVAIPYVSGTFDSGAALEFSTLASFAEGAGGNAPDSNSLSPSWGALDTGWMTGFKQSGEELDDDTWVTGTPTNYGNLTQTTSDAGGASSTNCQGAIATRSLNAASEDPGAFATAQDRACVALTAAIRPAAAGGGPTVQPYYLRDQANAAQFKFGFGQQG